jgi:hypothetical protein
VFYGERFKTQSVSVKGELEQGLRLMNLIDYKEERRAWELGKLSTRRA